MIREILFITFVFCVSTNAKTDKGRIVGGESVNIKDRPFQVALYIKGGFCGASIIESISRNKVVTAAHCVRGQNASTIHVYAGSSFKDKKGASYLVRHISIHPSYNPKVSNDFDVAVLTMRNPLEYYSNLQPIGLLGTKPDVGTMAIVSGWGSYKSGSELVPLLRQVAVPIVSQATCKSEYGRTNITDNMICAGYIEGGKDSCQGDSGGPLTINNLTIQLAGIVSFGHGCALPNFVGVYASVPELKSWINSQ